MAAKTKTELLDVTQKEFEKLSKLLVAMDSDTALKKRDDETCIKDVIGHRAHWIDLFFGWYTDGLAGKDVYFPAEGYKWNDLKRYNADLRRSQIDLDWPGAIEMLQTRQAKLTNFIEGCSEKELYGGPMKGANNAWSPGRWAEAAGGSHFRSASKYLRSCLRDDKRPKS